MKDVVRVGTLVRLHNLWGIVFKLTDLATGKEILAKGAVASIFWTSGEVGHGHIIRNDRQGFITAGGAATAVRVEVF